MILSKRAWLTLSLLLGTGVLVPEEARAEEIPSVLWSRHDSTKAAWVSVDRATGADGQIDWGLFGDLQSATLRRRVESPEGKGCVSIGSLRKSPMGSRIAHDFRGLSQNALGVFRGTVVASGVGFADGDPATLLEVRVDETIKASSDFVVDGTLFVAYPVAEFSVGGVRLCKSDERLTSVPRVGDGVLVLPLSGPLNEDRNMVYLYEQEIVVQHRGGLLAVPRRWAKAPELEKASSLLDVTAAVKACEKPRTEGPREEVQ